MTRRLWPIAAAVLLVAAPARSRADPAEFRRGALIIPMQSYFQPQGGMASAYGLVYRVLLANAPGHRNAANPVTVYVVNNAGKSSPNRCVPTNLTSFVASVPQPTSAKWNDGCDVTIVNAARQPVVPVDYSLSFPQAPALYPDAKIPTFNDAAAWPQYQAVTGGLTTTSGFTTVSYLGAPFVIDASDAPNVIALLRNGDTGANAVPKAAIDLFTDSQKRYDIACSATTLDASLSGTAACTCTPKNCASQSFNCGDAGDGCGGIIHCGTCGGAKTCGVVSPNVCGTGTCTPSGSCPAGGCGMIGTGCGATLNCGTCPSGKLCGIVTPNVCSTPTPVISSGCHNVLMHQATTSFSANVSRRFNRAPPPFALYEAEDGTRGGTPLPVLEGYVKVAGLWTECTGNGADVMGCPAGNVSGCSYNGTLPVGLATPADPTTVNHGLLYDFLGTADIDYVDASYPNGILNYAAPMSAPFYSLFWAPHWQTTNDANGNDVSGIASVAWFASHGGNVAAECASINSFENGFGAALTYNVGSASDGCGGACGTNLLLTKGITVQSANGGTGLQNCSDPGASATCANFPNPGNVFGQTGDWRYAYQSGQNDGYVPASALQVTTQPMVTTSNGSHTFDLGQPNGAYGMVAYLTGHDLHTAPMGARLALGATLNLSADPISSQRTLASATVGAGASDPASYLDLALVSAYRAISGHAVNPGLETFRPASIERWVFPFTPGELFATPLQGSAALPAGTSTLSASSGWSAAASGNGTGGVDEVLVGGSGIGLGPAPGSRNLFTYFGGYPAAMSLYAGGAPVPHGVLAQGWVPESVSGAMLASATQAGGGLAGGCVDVMGGNTSSLTAARLYDDCEHDDATCSGSGSALRLVVGSDGLCDLQEAVNLSAISDNQSWAGTGADLTQYLGDTASVAQMLQLVRGYCYAGGPLTPTYTQCLAGANVAALGAAVHSAAAVVAPTPNVPDAGGRHRPSVAYLGGWDGQLHAFYLGGGSGYTGPASALHFSTASDAAAVFATSLGGTAASPFVPPAQGTELWSFLPASQLPHLAGNYARVDSSPVVADVFADFGGTGTSEWHSVLVASIGRQGSELFALDVTNPLKPRLLWDVVGSTFVADSLPYYSPTVLLSDALHGPSSGTAACAGTPLDGSRTALPGSCDAPKWRQETTQYKPAPAPYSSGGPIMTKVYDYQDLGGALALAAGEVTVGATPTTLAFAATAMPAGRTGIEIFAIDLATGQKLWQWEHAYGARAASGPADYGNVMPASVSLLPGASGAARVLVGDYEGRLWELDAATGMNLDVTSSAVVCGGASLSAPCSFPAFDAWADAGSSETQPITTGVGEVKLPGPIPAGKVFTGYDGASLLLLGTAGSDYLAAPAAVRGRLYALLDDPGYRVNIFTGTAADGAAAASTGVLKKAPTFPVVFPVGERIYGSLTAWGESALFATATAPFSLDVAKVSPALSGSVYALNLASATGSAQSSLTTVASGQAGYGGAQLYVPTCSGLGVIQAEVGAVFRGALSSSALGGCCTSADCSITGQTCQSTICACSSGQTVCKQGTACIAAGQCCTSADCTAVVGQTCQVGACACPGGQALCALGTSCIAAGSCCSTADCSGTGVTCQAGKCQCPAGEKLCGASCIPDAGCCLDADCSAVAGQTCQSTVCACPGGQAVCTQGTACIAAGSCCSGADCTAAAGETCQAGKCQCPTGAKLCGASCIPAADCCTSGDCSAIAGQTCQAGACSCPGGETVCLQGSACIASGGCCGDGDCLGIGETCQSGTCACPGGEALCALGTTCVAPGGCCSVADCTGAGVACQAGACQCASGQKLCGGACIPSSSCCLDSDCSVPGQTCQSGACACPGGQALCQQGSSCIAPGACCTTADCGASQTCQAGSCQCAAGEKLCHGACIASASCCDDADCAALGNADTCSQGSCTCGGVPPCDDGRSCQSHACVFTCGATTCALPSFCDLSAGCTASAPAGTVCCECTSASAGCGSDCQSCATSHADAVSCAGSDLPASQSCQPSCSAGWLDLDGDGANGCEAPCRFEPGTDTVSDHRTGLTWQRAPALAGASWADATSYCQSLTLGGFATGWRLPAKKELEALVDEHAHDPAIDLDAFPATSPSGFWSSTPLAGDAGSAWLVSFSDGASAAALVSETHGIRCVR